MFKKDKIRRFMYFKFYIYFKVKIIKFYESNSIKIDY